MHTLIIVIIVLVILGAIAGGNSFGDTLRKGVGCLVSLVIIFTITIYLIFNAVFDRVDLSDCQRCGGDGCINNTELSNLISTNSDKSEEDIKLFQDWLDKNHPLWINDNGKWKNLRVGTESEPNRHIEGKGYGIFDQRTSAQFEKWGSDYYKVGPCPICNNDRTC